LWRGFGRHRRLARTKSGRLRRLRRSHVHEGVDIGADPGTPILAANDGLVAYSDNGMRGYGNAVVLVHRDGSVTLYAHCSATFVAAGETVRRGQIIAAVGATGLAHGPHLHFEWRAGGRARDPLPHFAERPGDPPDAPDDPSRAETEASATEDAP
ncbi:MAG: M23 family metallopeptidase, partial [Myxococcota bacterium]|nr:M23 family metallopeptidase [Myxococcota bacterium]